VAIRASARRHDLAPWLLVPPVAAVHLLLSSLWPDDRFGLGDGTAAPARIEVAFVRDLQPAKPATPPAALPATRVLRATRPRAAASAASSTAPSEPIAVDEELREVAPAATLALPEIAATQDVVAALAPAAAAASASASPSAAEAAPSAPAWAAPPAIAFEWPPSTRLSYLLTGNYRGPVEGQARVEWRLAGDRYQVSLEVAIGPPFAPLVTRQLQSDGVVTAAGLEPRRYDEETSVVLRSPRRLTIALDADRVVLPSGRQVPRPPGLQDSASQFVQMTWIFTTQPERLKAGQQLQLALALPRHVEVWTYEVIGPQTLETPVGPVETVHVRPLRPPRPSGEPRGGGDLTAEFWVAPSLQYLPVRFLIRQDEDTFVDLMLERLPQQAGQSARQ
jgi:hypothetical protein